MTAAQITQEIADLQRRVARGELDAGAAAPRLLALEARLEALT